MWWTHRVAPVTLFLLLPKGQGKLEQVAVIVSRRGWRAPYLNTPHTKGDRPPPVEVLSSMQRASKTYPKCKPTTVSRRYAYANTRRTQSALRSVSGITPTPGILLRLLPLLPRLYETNRKVSHAFVPSVYHGTPNSTASTKMDSDDTTHHRASRRFV